MRVIVTGADGFLGWHTRVRLKALTNHEVIPVDVAQWHRLTELVATAGAVLHFAGVNRGSDREVDEGNARLAQDLADAIYRAPEAPAIVYANTIQAGNGSPYGTGKAMAATILEGIASAKGASYTDVVLPNLYGEHGRPGYNSFVATFAHKVVAGETPEVQDRAVELLHVQDAAQVFLDQLDAVDQQRVRPPGIETSVATVWQTLNDQYSIYRAGDFPSLPDQFSVDMFNTLRAAMFPACYPMPLVRRTDPRGSLVEAVRAHGSEGQTFISSTLPGVTRGQHFHLRKVERFVVVAGQARIALRRVLTDDVVTFDVDGTAPVILDMPTAWTHNITNTGASDLITMFWSNEIFDPQHPDTYAEEV